MIGQCRRGSRISSWGEGGAVKKIGPSRARRKNFWGISWEKLRFYAYFFPILGWGAQQPPGSAPAMGKNQNTWSHRTKIIFCEIKIIFHHLGSLACFPARVIVLWQENVRGTRNASFAGNRYNVVFKYLRQRSNGLRIYLPAVFYMFSWFHLV